MIGLALAGVARAQESSRLAGSDYLRKDGDAMRIRRIG
jgi:hypothetical protein